MIEGVNKCPVINGIPLLTNDDFAMNLPISCNTEPDLGMYCPTDYARCMKILVILLGDLNI